METTKIIIFAGQLLKHEEFITVHSLRKYIAGETSQGGVWLPESEIMTTLMVLKIGGFLEEALGVYTFANKTVIHEQKIVNVCEFDKSLPTYIDGIEFEDGYEKKGRKKNVRNNL